MRSPVNYIETRARYPERYPEIKLLCEESMEHVALTTKPRIGNNKPDIALD